MNFTKGSIFYPHLALALPAVGRFSAATLTAGNKLVFIVTFDGAVRFLFNGFTVLIFRKANYFNIFFY